MSEEIIDTRRGYVEIKGKLEESRTEMKLIIYNKELSTIEQLDLTVLIRAEIKALKWVLNEK